MNPSSVSASAAPPSAVNDVAGPAPAGQPPATSNVVANIPVHNPAVQAAGPNEDEELDKIMRDVGREMKKEDKKPGKRGLLHFGRKAKTPPPATAVVPAMPAPRTVPAPQPAIIPQVSTAATQALPQAAPAAPAKPKRQSSTPVFAIFVTILVTGFLIAAAVAAYRQS